MSSEYQERPSTPQDDIVAGLRKMLADNRMLWAEERALIDRAIAALGEKEALLAQRDALQGKLKVAVEALDNIKNQERFDEYRTRRRMAYLFDASERADEALAQIEGE